MSEKPILMVVGPSQVGKSAAITSLVQDHGYSFMTPCTTRAPRPEEVEGQDYHFLTQQRFQELVLERTFVDWDYFLGQYGGISRESFLSAPRYPLVFPVLARMALRVEQRFPNVTTVFLAPEDVSMVYDRVKSRFSHPTSASARLAHVDEELLHASMFRHTVTVTRAMTVANVAQALADVHRREAR